MHYCLTPTQILADVQDIFDSHKSILERKYESHHLGNFLIEPMQTYWIDWYERIQSTERPMKKNLIRLALKCRQRSLKERPLHPHWGLKTIFVNFDFYRNKYKDVTKKVDFHNYLAGLTFDVIYVCCATFPLSVASQELRLSKQFIPWKTIYNLVLKLLMTWNIVTDFCTIQYLQEYVKYEYTRTQSQLCNCLAGDEEQTTIDRLAFLLTLEKYVKRKEVSIARDSKLKEQYEKLQGLFQTRGCEGVKDSIRNPRLIVKRSLLLLNEHV